MPTDGGYIQRLLCVVEANQEKNLESSATGSLCCKRRTASYELGHRRNAGNEPES